MHSDLEANLDIEIFLAVSTILGTQGSSQVVEQGNDRSLTREEREMNKKGTCRLQPSHKSLLR
jgi:hypothetical protein